MLDSKHTEDWGYVDSLAKMVDQAATQRTIQENRFFHDDWLDSAEHRWMHRYVSILVMTMTVSACISVISSCILVRLMLRRCNYKLSTTLQRLEMGLCLSDCITACTIATLWVCVPRDLDYISMAPKGNLVTCTVSGFFLYMGIGVGGFYINCLWLFAVLVVKHKKTDAYILKVEPFMHACSILLPLMYAVIALFTESFNSNGQACFAVKYDPPHCWGVERGTVVDGFTIPCGRGSTTSFAFVCFSVSFQVMLMIGFIILMSIVYKDVHKNEVRMKKYGSHSFRRNILMRTSVNNDEAETTESPPQPKWRFIMKRIRNRNSRGQGSRVLSQAESQTRAVVFKGISHIVAWFLSRCLFQFIRIFTSTPGKQDMPFVLAFLLSALMPLHATFYLIIYTYPDIAKVKRSDGEDTPLLKAIWKVLWMGSETKRKLEEQDDQKPKKRRRSSVSKSAIQKVQLQFNGEDQQV